MSDEKRVFELFNAEFANLALKVKNNAVAVDYFRKNLFNATVRDSYDLKRKKIIFQNEDMTIKCDRSLNQRHRDLFALLAHERKSKIFKDGSYYVKTSLYRLAKKMGYRDPHKRTHLIRELLDDMRKTLLFVKIGHRELSHSLIGRAWYDELEDIFIVEIPAETSRYLIYSYAMSIPKDLNEKIVQIPHKKAKSKALISYLLANRPTENGISFKAICEKLDITDKSKKSRFKKEILENLELLQEFGIEYNQDQNIFYVREQKTKFIHALDDKQLFASCKKELKGKEIEVNGEKWTIEEFDFDKEKGKYYIIGVNLFGRNKIYFQPSTLNDVCKSIAFYTGKFLEKKE